MLGRTGRPVSVIGLGTWQLGADWGSVTDSVALAVLHAAAESGVGVLQRRHLERRPALEPRPARPAVSRPRPALAGHLGE